jgi:predicted phage tail protein
MPGPGPLPTVDAGQGSLVGRPPGGGLVRRVVVVAVVALLCSASAITPVRAATPSASLVARVIAPTAATVHRANVTFKWTRATAAPIGTRYDVRLRSGRIAKRSAAAGSGAWSMLTTNTTRTSRHIKLRSGYTTCVSVRAIDKAGRTGPWSASRCISRLT